MCKRIAGKQDEPSLIIEGPSIMFKKISHYGPYNIKTQLIIPCGTCLLYNNVPTPESNVK